MRLRPCSLLRSKSSAAPRAVPNCPAPPCTASACHIGPALPRVCEQAILIESQAGRQSRAMQPRSRAQRSGVGRRRRRRGIKKHIASGSAEFDLHAHAAIRRGTELPARPPLSTREHIPRPLSGGAGGVTPRRHRPCIDSLEAQERRQRCPRRNEGAAKPWRDAPAASQPRLGCHDRPQPGCRSDCPRGGLRCPAALVCRRLPTAFSS